MLAVIKERSKAFLETIWDSWKGNADEKFGTVYGNVLYVSDLMSLKIEEELNDQIINLYCSVLQKRTDQCVQKVSSADCLILTSIFEGRKSVTWFKKDDIQQYDTVIGCINDGKCHWVAVVMDVQHHIVTIMDPLKISKKLRTYEKNFNYFTKSRDLGTWTICTAVGYPLQNDFSSCGVYCLKFLDRYLSKTDTSLELNVQAERFTIGSEIVQAVQTKGAVMTCFLCAKEPTNMRACSCCKRNFHKKCMTPGLCSLCSIFPPEKVRHSKRGKKEQQQKSIQILDENESFRQSKKDKKEEEQESSENVDQSENLRQSKKDKKEEEQKSSENVDQSENLRQSKKDKKEEEQKSSENVDESGNVRQSKRGKKEQEKKSSENVDESENVRNLKRVKKEEQKSTENEDESGNVRQSKRRKKEQEQSLENVDKREHARKPKRGKKEEKQKSLENVDERVDNVRQPKIQKKDEDQKSTENVDESGTSETTDWNEITSFEKFRIANIRPVRSRLQSMKTNKTEKRMIYMVKGDEITARVQGPDRMSVHQIGDYLTIGKSNTTQQNRKELSRLVNLIPKPTNIVPPITSAWSMLTNGDVDYQVQSLNTLTEALVDKEATKKAVCKKMKGTSAQKKGDIEKTKEIVGHVIAELNKTNVNKAMHGKVFEAFWKTIQTMLPDDSSER